MLATLSILPLDNPHMSGDVRTAVQAIKVSGLPDQVNAMSTCVEGDWD
jgi:uncharacterized protein YqgV (UPF0045/DUF77 family)